MKKWLDKYDVPKAENGIEGTMGGLTDQGFNYNGAWGGQFAMGGSLPGAVGFTYARTSGAAPANGPYAKKTKASAENGKYIKGKVRDIEDKLQDRFIKPDVDKAFEQARRQGIDYGAYNGPLDAIRHATSASKIASSIPIIGLPIANVLGAAHEISANRGNRKELLSDLYNNFMGSVIGSVPFISDDTRRKLVVEAQKRGILSTIDNTKKESFENGGSMKYYQEGLDWQPRNISRDGINIADEAPIEKLDQLLNFTNYNKPTKGGWLNKYED